jgi:hypoxanthine-guanine phosphoribosyltransferase
MLHELYMAQGVKPICLPVVAQSYQGYEQGDVNVLNLDVVTERVQASDVLLIVDDICDSGATLKSLREKLESKTGALVMTATLFHAEERNKTDEAPDFWIEKTDKWVVFPHEIQ